MAYHSDFWLLVGTAAPVLALAHAVAMGSVARTTTRIFVAVEEAATPQERRKLTRFSVVPLGISLVALTCSTAALGLALFSASRERDSLIGLATLTTFLPLVLLVQQVPVEMKARRLTRHLPNPGRDE